jgi:hypothetical protein
MEVRNLDFSRYQMLEDLKVILPLVLVKEV